MSSVGGVRLALLVQAALVALFALRSPITAWSVAGMVLAAGAIFLAQALQPAPLWRTVVLAFEAFAVAFGVVALASGHLVPGTVVAAAVLALVGKGAAALAFAGTPAAQTWPVLTPTTAEQAVPELAGVAPGPATFAPAPTFAPASATFVAAPAEAAPPELALELPAPPVQAWYPPPTVPAAVPSVPAAVVPVVPAVPAAAVPPVPAAVVPVVPVVPAQPAAPRVLPAAMTILPGKR